MQLPIPEEFRSDLRYVESLDARTDEKILDSLSKHAPVTSEKNVWTFWHSGVRSMPGWCQRNVVNWIRVCGSSWSIRVLDNVPSSPNNALKWVPEELLPETFVKGTMDGPYTGPHSADFLRGACLYLYGGVWMDVGIILIRQLDNICWRQLEDPESPFEVSVPWMYGTVMANHFVASRKDNPFIKRWHDLFVHLWKDRTNPGGIIENPLVSFGKEVKFEDSQARNFHWEFKVEPRTVMEYIGQVLAWLRMCMLEDPSDGFNGAEYYANKVLLFDSLSEDWGAEEAIGFSGQDLFDVLATRRDVDMESEEYQKAYKTIWRLLTHSSMQKITHGKELTKGLALGVLWDMKENEGKDIAPGTFAELLRYGSVHFEQEREAIKYVEAQKPTYRIRKDPRISDLGRTITDDYATIRAKYRTPSNPIVLAHGLLGFDELHLVGKLLPGVHYWRGITEALQANNIEVILTSVPPSASIEERAAKLSNDIEKKAHGKSVNIVAHSMGGLDARYMISRLKPPNVKVLSLTTVASPHRGSAFADYVFEQIGPENLPRMYRALQLMRIETGAFSQLTRRYMVRDFNPKTPDREGVRYFSYGAMATPPLWSAFRQPHRIVQKEEGPNDGLVSVASSRWGTYKGTLVDVSHLDLINWTNRLRWLVWEMTGNKRNFNAIAFYLDIADMLAQEGY